MEGLGVDKSFWRGLRVLVTGHTGFKGAWLSLWLSRLGAKVTGVAQPPEDPNGAFSKMLPWQGLESHFLDIRDGGALSEVFDRTQPQIVFHLAAQSLVRRGWNDPAYTYSVNIVGTSNVLSAARRSGAAKAIVVVTSDKVYADKLGIGAKETDELGGSDPYSVSKAAAELVVRAWRPVAPTPVATARAGNVVGGGDVCEDRLLPDIWRALQAGKPARLRYPAAIRPWQFVLEPLAGYLQFAQCLATRPEQAPPALNFGPAYSAALNVGQVADKIFKMWGSGHWERDGSENPPEAPSLRLDASLATQTLGWQPRLDLDAALEWTLEWWRCVREGADMRKFAKAQLDAYEELAAG